jgi:hypothetical protein
MAGAGKTKGPEPTVENESDLNPAWLPAGTRVWPWRVLERRGRGSYGAVYRATPSPQPRAQGLGSRRWLAASVGVPLALGVGWALRVQPGNESAQGQPESQMEDGDTVAVGDTALTAPVASPGAPSVWRITAEQLPPKPLPGQLRPDARGRCPLSLHVPINGGCWMELRVDPKKCDAGYEYKGGCYVPAYPPPRVPTASPAEPSRDGG